MCMIALINEEMMFEAAFVAVGRVSARTLAFSGSGTLAGSRLAHLLL